MTTSKSMYEQVKKTEIGEIPEEWQVVRLGDVAEIRGNKAVNNFENVAFIPMELVPDSKIYVRYEVRNKNDVKSFTYCEGNDLLLAKITPSVENGKQGIVPEDIPNGFALATTEVFPIVCKEKLDVLYLHYLLKFSKFRHKLIVAMTGTTGRQRVPKNVLINLKLPLPPLPEQRRIAKVLATVDAAIEKTEEEIKHTEKLKNGLMQRLLTRGIGHEKFKKSEIGEIPEEWKVVRLGDVLTILRNGLVYKQNKKEGEYPITRIETISNGYIDATKVGYVEMINPDEINKYKLIDGDILFSHINSLKHIGKVAIYKGEPKLLLHGMNLLLLRPDASKIDSFFLLYLLRRYRTIGIFKSMAKKAVNQASINQTELRNLKLSLPPLPEQRKIAEILSTIDKKLGLLRERRERLERVKKGLMNDLLTGRKRVPKGVV